MDILLQSDGQLYPPKRQERRPAPPPPPKPKPEPTPSAPPIPWEERVLAAVAYVLIKNSDKPDIPLLLALAYVFFDQKFPLNFLL